MNRPKNIDEQSAHTIECCLETLMSEIYRNAKEKGFYDIPPSDLERICLTHSELSEAVEFVRHGNPPSDHIPEFSGLEEELSDAVIRILDHAAYRKLRLPEAILAKMAFNENRPYKHGKKC